MKLLMLSPACCKVWSCPKVKAKNNIYDDHTYSMGLEYRLTVAGRRLFLDRIRDHILTAIDNNRRIIR
jgi:hypothetical protein